MYIYIYKIFAKEISNELSRRIKKKNNRGEASPFFFSTFLKSKSILLQTTWSLLHLLSGPRTSSASRKRINKNVFIISSY